MARIEYLVGEPGVDAYHLLTGLVLPRPIAWVSTTGADGIGNLAPHSFFNVVSGDPPMVMFATLGRKDTVINCADTGEFTVSLAGEPSIAQVNNSSARFGPEVDEARALGIEMTPSRLVGPPRVTDSPAALECRVHQIVELPTSYVVIGEVVNVSIDEAVLTNGRPDIDKLRPLSRLGGNLWGHSPAHESLKRPVEPEDIS